MLLPEEFCRGCEFFVKLLKVKNKIILSYRLLILMNTITCSHLQKKANKIKTKLLFKSNVSFKDKIFVLLQNFNFIVVIILLT